MFLTIVICDLFIHNYIYVRNFNVIFLHFFPDYFSVYTHIHVLSFRQLSAVSVALLRVIIHSVFVYTLQTRNMKDPTYITELVEYPGRRSFTDYFSLHLTQDIRDVTAVCNKTFEEAILIVHTLIDHLLTVQPDERKYT